MTISEPKIGSPCGSSKDAGMLVLNRVTAAHHKEHHHSEYGHFISITATQWGGRSVCYHRYLSSPEVDLSALQHWWCHRGSVKEELGERERPTDIRWMLGNAVCYSRNTDPHSREVSVSQRLRGTSTHTRTYADMLCSNKRLTDELFCDRLLLSIYQADSTCITNAGGNMYWMGRQCYPAVYHHSSPLFTCQSESTWDHNHTHTRARARWDERSRGLQMVTFKLSLRL